jgi:hypothetical protein
MYKYVHATGLCRYRYPQGRNYKRLYPVSKGVRDYFSDHVARPIEVSIDEATLTGLE